MKRQNIDYSVVEDFGREWKKFDQTGADKKELEDQFNRYFSIFPWEKLPTDAIGFDLGCGSGRWARLVAPRIGHLHCIDPSAEALAVARRNLADCANCTFYQASANSMPIGDSTADFGYTLGVLHHVPDTISALKACVRKLKPGAPLLLYLYYAFDNRPRWYRWLWHASNVVRILVSRTPFPLKYAISQIVAAIVYLPAARLAVLLEKIGCNVSSLPLAQYRNLSFYVMRTDALDRFGTRLEKRFTKVQITEMMREAGLGGLVFSSEPPHWCALGYRLSD